MTDTSGPQAPPRRLTRSASDRMVAGVCGGLARYTGIDPVIFRVALAVATVLGGAGVVAYAIAWIVIPADDAPESHAETLLRERRLPRWLAVAMGIVAACVVLALLDNGPLGDDGWGGGGIGLLVLVGVAVWLFNRDRPVAPPPVPPVAPAAPAAPAVEAATPTPVPPAPPSKLPALVLGTMLVVAGLLALVEVADVADVGMDVALSVLLVVLGAGLLVGAWYGRARSLILLGIPLTAFAAVATVMDVPFAGGAGERSWYVSEPEELGEYRLGIGEAVLDLSDLDLDGGREDVEVSLAIGELRVVLPPGVAVELDARTGLGEVVAPGFYDDGADVRRRDRLEGSGGTLELEARLGIGRLEVVR